MPPAPVPETALKKRRRDEEWAAARATAAAEARSKRAASRADAFKRAESYVKEYRAQVGGFVGFSSVARLHVLFSLSLSRATEKKKRKSRRERFSDGDEKGIGKERKKDGGG